MADEVIGQLIADKFRVESLLKTSDIGNFYRCRHEFTKRELILEIMRGSGEAARRGAAFLDRIRAVASVAHPNVLSVTDVGRTDDGRSFAVFEYAHGQTLRELGSQSRIPQSLAFEIALQAAAGLSAAAAAGVIHGSLSPENILLIESAGTDTVKLFGFGSPNPLLSGFPLEYETGELAYVAPELCAGAERPDAVSDVYSMGVILYEMLAGDPPFMAATPAGILNKHVEDAPPPLSSFRRDLAPAIEPVVLKALAKAPALRYQTASELADAIALGASVPLYNAAMPAVAGAPPAVSAAAASNVWKTAFIVMAAIALLSTFLIYATSVRRDRPTTGLQPDANSQPVQPIGPATGADEQNLAVAAGLPNNANTAGGQQPGTLPGGDGYNAWANGGIPPPGAPALPRGGRTVTIDPNSPSPFMPPDGCIPQPSGILLCPAPIPVGPPASKPTPTPRSPAGASPAVPDANSAPKPVLPKPTPSKTPPAKPAAAKPSPDSKPAR